MKAIVHFVVYASADQTPICKAKDPKVMTFDWRKVTCPACRAKKKVTP